MNTVDVEPNIDNRNYVITLFVDEEDAWIMPWVTKLADRIAPFHQVFLCTNKDEIRSGNFAFLLGCTHILPSLYLKRNKLNLVVHESDLPKGRGWSPVAWQVLMGAKSIPVSLFEACEELDAGPIWLRDEIKLDGTELLSEIRKKQGEATIRIILSFLKRWPNITPEHQMGKSTYYRRRTAADDEIDVRKPLTENFDHLRIADNDRYPAWFEYRGSKYILKIMKDKLTPTE